jgi:hypothetical protein
MIYSWIDSNISEEIILEENDECSCSRTLQTILVPELRFWDQASDGIP